MVSGRTARLTQGAAGLRTLGAWLIPIRIRCHRRGPRRTRSGPLEVPPDAYYGVQTQRAISNFPISGRLPDPALVAAAVQVKKAAARANRETGRLSDDLADAIIQAADEVLGLRRTRRPTARRCARR